jgi:NAD(P)-dependent dehydrogenase (short-subunit alcohol dehydrogenase family)
MERTAVVTGGTDAIIGVTRTLGGHGVRVNAVAPGLTPTPAAQEGVDSQAFDAARARQTLNGLLFH